jgi:DNA-binding transcriptional MocR family regulator
MVNQDCVYGNFRLNYSTVDEEKIELGIKVLGEVLKSI